MGLARYGRAKSYRRRTGTSVDRPPFRYVNYQRSACTFGDDVVLIPESFEPALNGAFGHSGVLCNRADAAVESSGSSIRVDDQVQEKPHRSPHSMVMPRRRRDDKAPPNEPPPLGMRPSK